MSTTRRGFSGIAYVGNGSIGDFLMLLCAAESLRASGFGGDLRILLTKNTRFLAELGSGCAAAQVVSVAPRDFWRSRRALWSIFSSRSLVVGGLTFGAHGPAYKLFLRILAARRGSSAAIFEDGRFLSRLLGLSRVPFDVRAPVLSTLLSAPRAAGVQVGGEVSALPCLSAAPVDGFGAGDSPYVVVHPTGATIGRSWPIEKWRKTLAVIASQFPTLRFALTGSAADCERNERIAAGLPQVANLAGSLAPAELVGLIDGATCYLGVDTGVSHLAAVRRAPSVIVGNRTNPCWRSTYAPETVWLEASERCTCRGDKTGGCGELAPDGHRYPRCMLDILEDSVAVAVADKIASWYRDENVTPPNV